MNVNVDDELREDEEDNQANKELEDNVIDRINELDAVGYDANTIVQIIKNEFPVSVSISDVHTILKYSEGSNKIISGDDVEEMAMSLPVTNRSGIIIRLSNMLKGLEGAFYKSLNELNKGKWDNQTASAANKFATTISSILDQIDGKISGEGDSRESHIFQQIINMPQDDLRKVMANVDVVDEESEDGDLEDLDDEVIDAEIEELIGNV